MYACVCTRSISIFCFALLKSSIAVLWFYSSVLWLFAFGARFLFCSRSDSVNIFWSLVHSKTHVLRNWCPSAAVAVCWSAHSFLPKNIITQTRGKNHILCTAQQYASRGAIFLPYFRLDGSDRRRLPLSLCWFLLVFEILVGIHLCPANFFSSLTGIDYDWNDKGKDRNNVQPAWGGKSSTALEWLFLGWRTQNDKNVRFDFPLLIYARLAILFCSLCINLSSAWYTDEFI